MTALRLDAEDDAVWARTMDALKASRDVAPTLTLRCSVASCGATLARVGIVPEFGPLFTSSWPANVDMPIAVDGARLNRRQAYRRAGSDAKAREDVDGSVALLVPGATGDVAEPVLFVRCVRHGDAVLALDDVLGWLATRPMQAVDVGPQRIDLAARRPPSDWGNVGAASEMTRTKTVYRPARPRPLDELRKLGRRSSDGPHPH